jgi:hypothetical protein
MLLEFLMREQMIRKKESCLIILFILIFGESSCIPLNSTMLQDKSPLVQPKQIIMRDKPKGSICYTGLQLRYSSDFINISDFLDKKIYDSFDNGIRKKLSICKFDELEQAEYRNEVYNTDRVSFRVGLGFNSYINTVTVANGKVFIADEFDYVRDHDIRMLKSSTEFLNRKIGADYYLSITCWFSRKMNSDRLKISKYALLVVSIYNKYGEKIFCKNYSENYKEYNPDEGKSDGISSANNPEEKGKNEFTFLSDLLSYYAQEINADLAFIENM